MAYYGTTRNWYTIVFSGVGILLMILGIAMMFGGKNAPVVMGAFWTMIGLVLVLIVFSIRWYRQS